MKRLEKHKLKAENIHLGDFPWQLNFSLLYEFHCWIGIHIGAQQKCLGEKTFCPRAGGNFIHTQGEPSAHRLAL